MDQCDQEQLFEILSAKCNIIKHFWSVAWRLLCSFLLAGTVLAMLRVLFMGIPVKQVRLKLRSVGWVVISAPANSKCFGFLVGGKQSIDTFPWVKCCQLQIRCSKMMDGEKQWENA